MWKGIWVRVSLNLVLEVFESTSNAMARNKHTYLQEHGAWEIIVSGIDSIVFNTVR